MVRWLHVMVTCKLYLSVYLSKAQLNYPFLIDLLQTGVLLPALLPSGVGDAGPPADDFGPQTATHYQCGGRAGQQGQAVGHPICDRGREE